MRKNGAHVPRDVPSGSLAVAPRLTMIPIPFCRTRIYFLSTPSNGWETTLLYVDIAHADHANGYRLHWQPVIEANFQR